MKLSWECVALPRERIMLCGVVVVVVIMLPPKLRFC